MTVSRRTLLSMTVAGAAGAVMAPRTGLAAETTPAILAADFTSHFGGLGYAPEPPLAMITGDAFNGGLRYDETRPEPVPGKSLFVQPAARVEDRLRAGEPGVLAFFTVCGIQVREPAEPGSLFGELVRWLVEQRKLDPDRLVFVSTDAFGPYADRYALVKDGRVVTRPREEAMASGDGSGFFAPENHPAKPAFDTVSIHYPLQDPLQGAAEGELSYPLPGHLEIGEVSITPLDRRAVGLEVGGVGLERLAMVEGGAAPDFETSRQALLQLVEKESVETGQPLPEGHALFSRT